MKLPLGPPPVFVVFSFLDQQVASGLTNAFAGVSGLDAILAGLEGRGAPTQKPQAIKRKFPKAKAAPAKAPAAAPAKAPASAPAPVPPPAPFVLDKAARKRKRNCVHSCAYKKAAKEAKAAGLPEAEVAKAASAAGKAATAQWDKDNA